MYTLVVNERSVLAERAGFQIQSQSAHKIEVEYTMATRLAST